MAWTGNWLVKFEHSIGHRRIDKVEAITGPQDIRFDAEKIGKVQRRICRESTVEKSTYVQAFNPHKNAPPPPNLFNFPLFLGRE